MLGASLGSPYLLEPPRDEAEMPTSPQPLQLCSPRHRNTRWGRQSQVPGHLRCARPCSGWEDSIRTHDHLQTTVRLPDSPHPSPPVGMRPDPLQEGDRPGTQALTLTHTSCPGRTGETRGVAGGAPSPRTGPRARGSQAWFLRQQPSCPSLRRTSLPSGPSGVFKRRSP